MVSGFGVSSGNRSWHQRISWICFCYRGNHWGCWPLHQVFELFSAWRTTDHHGKGTAPINGFWREICRGGGDCLHIVFYLKFFLQKNVPWWVLPAGLVCATPSNSQSKVLAVESIPSRTTTWVLLHRHFNLIDSNSTILQRVICPILLCPIPFCPWFLKLDLDFSWKQIVMTITHPCCFFPGCLYLHVLIL